MIPKAAFEFRSRATFLGLPLVHIRIGDRFDLLRRPVTAWIAVSNYSIGGLFAFGGIAVAPFSIGALAIGLLPFGGLVAGISPVGGLALGVWAFGGVAIGWQAIGGLTMAWNEAVGGVALAHDFAMGGVARALQANTDTARQLAESNWFFRSAHAASQHWFFMNLLWIAPLMIQWRLINRKRRLDQERARTV